MPKYDFRQIFDVVNPEYEKDFFACLLNEIFENLSAEGYECPICGNRIPLFLPSPSRDQVWCPKCGSYDRHRLVGYYLKKYTDIYNKKTKFLHFAPEPSLYYQLKNSETVDYLPVDIESGPRVEETIDMCSIPYPNNTFDIIYNSHVLEHIPDDIKAMKELYRCVKPSSEGGFVLIMVPLSRNLNQTFENESFNTDELRLKYFGQEDHVRIYGLDIKDRLTSVGFEVEEIICKNYFDEQTIKYYGFYPDETLFICKK